MPVPVYPVSEFVRSAIGRWLLHMILHVDMDAFYASIEERERPELAGQPVVVGGTPEGRGVVAAANYEARKFGIHSAMPAARAKRLCPHAAFLPSRIRHYAEVAEQIREIFHRYTPLVEPLSLDEAFLDATGSESLFGPAVEIGHQIKCEIREQLKLVASVGIAPNKFLAKIASDLDKPDGFVVLEKDRVQAFLDPLPVGRLWGVGQATDKTFQRLGVRTIGDVRRSSLQLLQQHFGESGRHLWRLARGIDDRPVTPDRKAKSISHETTFAADIDDGEVLKSWLVDLCEQVGWRLRRHRLRGRTVQLKMRFADFRTITRAKTLHDPTNQTQEICEALFELFEKGRPANRLPVRLVGVGVSGFENATQHQRRLFDEDATAAGTKLDRVTDEIRDRFGAEAVGRASRWLHESRERQNQESEDPDSDSP
jgi:DNA polymerase-4